MNTNTFTEEMSDDQTLRGLTQNTFSSEDWNSNYYSNSIVSEDMSGEKCLEEPTQSSYKLDNTVSKTVDDSGFFDDFAEEDVLQCISQNGFNSNDVKESDFVKTFFSGRKCRKYAGKTGFWAFSRDFIIVFSHFLL